MMSSPEEILEAAINKLSPEKALEAMEKFIYLHDMKKGSEVFNLAIEKERPEFYNVLDFLNKKFDESDRDMQGYLTVKIKKDFPEYEEYIKKSMVEQKNA